MKVVTGFNIHQNITYRSTNNYYESFNVEEVKNALFVA